MERLIKTLHLTNGELYYSQQANRYTLAHCEPALEIYEKSASVPVLGAGPGIKRTYFELVLCQDTQFCRATDEQFWTNTVAFSMKADAFRPDGVYETLYFDRLDLEEISADGTLTFSLVCPPELVKKLLAL